RKEQIAVVAHAEGEALGPAVDQAAREPAAQFVGGLLVVELIDDAAQVVAGNGAVETYGRDLGAPGRIERIKRPRHLQRALRSIARIGVGERRGPSRAEDVRIVPSDGVAGAVDGAAVRYLQPLAPAQEVRVLKIEAGVVAAAGPSEGYAGTQGPDILGDHLDIDFAVGVAHGHHARVVYVAQQAQGALGFGERAGLVLVAAGEQQPGFYGRSFGADVQPVRQ